MTIPGKRGRSFTKYAQPGADRAHLAFSGQRVACVRVLKSAKQSRAVCLETGTWGVGDDLARHEPGSAVE